MPTYCDASVLVAATWAQHTRHAAAFGWIAGLPPGEGHTGSHALLEAFAVLTAAAKVSPDRALKALKSITRDLHVHSLPAGEVWSLLAGCQRAGVMGGGIYDWQHVHVARAAGCRRWATYNPGDFARHARAGEEIFQP